MEELFDSTEIVSEGVTFSVTKGTPQGGKLSPDLFNYYLHKCILESPPLMKLMRERKLLAYADDIAVLATTEKEIQNATDEIKKLGKYGLCINFRKS
jgi:retron-type reverse transcriptase